jgi:hypothetical protein
MTVFLFEMSAMYALIVLFFRLGYQLIFLIGLAGNFQSKVLFEKKESEKLGETTVLQNRLHPSQQKIFDLLGTHCPPPSPVFPLFIRPSLACARAGACARTPESIRERSVDAATGNPVELSCWQSSRV